MLRFESKPLVQISFLESLSMSLQSFVVQMFSIGFSHSLKSHGKYNIYLSLSLSPQTHL